jgi:uncharacterized protein (TIGR02301 family)
MRRALLIFVLVAGLPAGAARAVEVVPFDTGLERLAEILGSLHYLRGICGANEGNKWRTEMQALIDAEAPSASSQFIAHFNRGYRPICGPTEPARRPPTLQSGAISKRAPRSPARSRRATAIEKRALYRWLDAR